MDSVNIEEKQTPVVRVGRPPAKDWPALKSEIEGLINDLGFGLGRLAKRYGISIAGMRGVLKKLNIRTAGQRA